MMKKKKGSLAVMALLVASVNCVINPSKEHLTGEFPANPQTNLCCENFHLSSLIHLIQFNVVFFFSCINTGTSSVT